MRKEQKVRKNHKLQSRITIKGSFLVLLITIILSVPTISAQSESQRQKQYKVSILDSLGGTSSGGNSINDRSWIAGYSNLAENKSRHATLWRNGLPLDLGTLGGINSSVTWSVKNNRGIVVGISQTATPEPNKENWSCSAFFPAPDNISTTCLGFVWENGTMNPLNPLPGGNNSFATSANNRGQIVGWAENGVHDPTCTSNQILQFRPVLWKSNSRQIQELPPLSGDTSGAATAINNRGQVVGISGTCDQAIGRSTAKHAVIWDRGKAVDIGNLGADFWNTPTAINERGDVVGFAGTPGDADGNVLHAFIWTKKDGIKPLPALTGHIHTEAYGINKRRQVVGFSCDEKFIDCRAVIWENGVITDLNTLKSPDFSARLEQAKDINDRGEITGRSFNETTNERRAFLVVTKREPRR